MYDIFNYPEVFYLKKIISLLLCFAMIFSLGCAAFAADGTTYYIDSVSGSDDNSGTSPEQAWKSIDKANQTVYSAGDKILLKCGETFTGMLALNGNGTEDAPIVISSYGEGEKPVIRADSGSFVMIIANVSNRVVENIEFTAPDGLGMFILAHSGEEVKNITVRNCYFHDIASGRTDTSSAALMIDNFTADSKIHSIHLDSLKFKDVSWAIHTNGINAESDKDVFESPEKNYNTDYLFENIYVKNAVCAGMVISAVLGCTVRNCRVLDCATAQDDPYAPLWIRHSKNVVVEYCEIAGATNKIDGMTVDFDGWTVDSTYRYIYSHDNNRFIKNCVYDADTHNAGNEVYNCVSVNDNKKMNFSAVTLISTSRPSLARMRDFSFHDNIIINGKPIFWLCTAKPQIKNIVFSSSPFLNFIQRLFNIFYKTENFSYEKPADSDVEALINEITANLPDGR